MRAFRCVPPVCALLAVVLVAGLAGTAVAEGTRTTSLRLTAPSSVASGSTATFHARLLTSAGPVSSRTVLLQRRDASGWVQIGSMTTRSDGLASKALVVKTSARYRAHFRGDATHAASTSAEVPVNVTQTLGERAVAEARRHAGKSYRYGAAGPSTFDCSGFTMYVYKQLGRSLPHNSGMQRNATRAVASSAKRPGDLIFTTRNGRITHVGLYAGGTSMWSPVQTGDHVRLQSFSGRTYTVGRVG